MFLGALVNSGVTAQIFEETVAALNIGARLEISRVVRSGITATKVDVYVHGEKELPREVYWEQRAHKHEHPHGHDHHHSHDHEPVALREHNFSLTQAVEDVPAKTRSGVPAPHEHAQEHGRGLKEIREIIRRSARARKIPQSKSSRLSERRKRRSTTAASKKFTFMRSERWTQWWISCALRLAPRHSM